MDRLVVLVCDRADQTIPAIDRAVWLEDASPDNVECVITPDDLPTENEPWAARALDLLPSPPDIAVTSEAWGPGWAASMGARHHSVDIARSSFPVSGTDLRDDLGQHFEWLVPAARSALARRVVIAGAESTGKTTLAEGLAQALGTVWVPEYGRTYWEGRRHLPDQAWTADEFVRIAEGQRRMVDDLARRSRRGVVISDTDSLVTSVWLRRYLGTADAAVDALAALDPPDLYLVCAPDFDWVQDGTRESADFRQQMHEETVEQILATGAAFEVLTGTAHERLARSLELVDPLLTFPPLV